MIRPTTLDNGRGLPGHPITLSDFDRIASRPEYRDMIDLLKCADKDADQPSPSPAPPKKRPVK